MKLSRWVQPACIALLVQSALLVQTAVLPAAATSSAPAASCANWPVVIAHRGDSGQRPEHTAAAYWRAMEQGADFIELDLVLSRDGVLLSRHENELSVSTNVATLPQFASRKTTKQIDGVTVTGWFSEDFTLAELRQLRARESKPAVRPANQQFDDQEGLLTLAEILDLVQRFEQQHGRAVGLYIETKHPTYFQQQLGTATGPAHLLTERLLQQLAPWQRQNKQTVYIQSFEISNLRWLRQQGLADYQVTAKLVQLLGDISGQAGADPAFAVPGDVQQAGTTVSTLPVRHYGDLVSPEGLKFVASYADGIGPWKTQWFQGSQAFVSYDQLQQHQLILHPYTFRAEPTFLPAGVTDFAQELSTVFRAGVDGIFTDQPAQAIAIRQQLCQQ